MIIDFNIIYSKLLELKPNIKISYLTSNEINKIANFPIKQNPEFGIFNEHYEKIKIYNGICLIILTNENENANEKNNIANILNTIPNLKYESVSYLNKKFAAVTAGLGQYGKNQLVYNEDFGFHHSIWTVMIFNTIINLPIRKEPKYSYLDLCTNCNECIKHCPAHAIHADDYPGWLDRMACQNFFLFGNHNIIPSTKYGINAFLNNKFTEIELKQITDQKKFKQKFGFFSNEGQAYKDNKIYKIDMHYCKECKNQLPCRKKEYIYDKNYYKVIDKKPNLKI